MSGCVWTAWGCEFGGCGWFECEGVRALGVAEETHSLAHGADKGHHVLVGAEHGIPRDASGKGRLSVLLWYVAEGEWVDVEGVFVCELVGGLHGA